MIVYRQIVPSREELLVGILQDIDVSMQCLLYLECLQCGSVSCMTTDQCTIKYIFGACNVISVSSTIINDIIISVPSATITQIPLVPFMASYFVYRIQCPWCICRVWQLWCMFCSVYNICGICNVSS